MLPVAVKPCTEMVMAALEVAGGVPSTVVALSVMFAGGALTGAVYVVGVPLAVVAGEIEPHTMTVQGMPFRLSVQSTLPFCRIVQHRRDEVLRTVQYHKGRCLERLTEMGGAPTVMLASWTSGRISWGCLDSHANFESGTNRWFRWACYNYSRCAQGQGIW
jgi:hypothetical protein